MGPRRRKPEPKHPRAVAEGAARCLECETPPSDGFADGVEAERNRRRMDPAYGEAYGLGEYVEPPSDGARPLHGHTAPVAFPAFWHAWFARQTKERLAEIDEIVDERLEREAISRFLRRVKHLAIAAVVIGFAGARWFSDQLAWIMEKLPVLRAFWHLITGATK